MPVCVTGMHRSGTSLVANLLRLSGLYLGEEDELLPPGPDNTEGYWEHGKFVSLNDAILQSLGSAWDSPPVIATDSWPYEERFNSLRVRAEVLLEEFVNREPWGWKDPRACLTLPFWQSLNGMQMPFWTGRGEKLKVVICFRDPLEVSQSLRDRSFTPNPYGLDLWLSYNQSVLDSTMPADRIITHYDAYFRDASSELQRVLDFVGMKVSSEVIEESTRMVSSSLRHQRSSIASLREANVNPEVIDLYLSLCEEASHSQPLNSYSFAP